MSTNHDNLNLNLGILEKRHFRLARRMCAVALSVVLTVSFSMPAFASDTVNSELNTDNSVQEQTMDEDQSNMEGNSENEEQEENNAAEEVEEATSVEAASEENEEDETPAEKDEADDDVQEEATESSENFSEEGSVEEHEDADYTEKINDSVSTDTDETKAVEGKDASNTSGAEPSLAAAGEYSDWLSDYEYSIDEDAYIIDLGGYHGADTSIIIPATAIVDGKEYLTRVSSCQNWGYGSIESITFAQGVKLSEDSGYMFYDLPNLTSVDISKADATSAKSMTYMFANCSKLESVNMEGINTSSVEDMSNMFQNCYALKTVNLTGLDTSAVTNMQSMFQECSSLTSLDLGSFITSSVSDMTSMFYNCSSLSSIDVTSFDTSSVQSAEQMFAFCSSLTSLDLSSFDLSHVASFHYWIFDGCTALQEIWTPRNLNSETMGEVYLPTTFMDDNGNRWDNLPTNNDTSIRLHVLQFSEWLKDYDYGIENDKIVLSFCYLRDAEEIVVPGSANIDGTEYTRVVLGRYLFSGTGVHHLSFGQGVELPEDSSELFCNLEELESVDFSKVDSSNVKYMYDMFRGCKNLTDPDLDSLDFSSVEFADSMLYGCSSLVELDLSSLDFGNILSGNYMIDDCTGLQKLWTPANAPGEIDLPFPMSDSEGRIWSEIPVLENSILLEKVIVSEWLNDYSFKIETDSETGDDIICLDQYSGDETEITVPGEAMVGDRQYEIVEPSFYTWGDSVTSLTFKKGVRFPEYSYGLFSDLRSLETLDLSEVDTSNVNEMTNMFSGCRSLKSLDLSTLDTSRVSNMSWMFSDCESLEAIDLSGLNLSSMKRDSAMEGIFNNCSSLTTIVIPAGVHYSVDLPAPFECDDGEIYTSLPKGTTEPHTLTKVSYSEWLKDYRFSLDGDTIVLKEYIGEPGGYYYSNDESEEVGTGYGLIHIYGNAQVGNKSFSRIQVNPEIFSGCYSVERMIFDEGVYFRGDCSYFFKGLQDLQTLDLSNVDVSEVEKGEKLFSECKDLQTIYTPVGLTVQIDLPFAFVDENSNIYGQLPQNLAESVTLTKAEASEWLKDYTYFVSEDKVILTNYIGSDESIIVPSRATINNKEYSTIQLKNDIWAYNDNISQIAFEEGVLLPEDSSGLFEGLSGVRTIDLRGLDCSNVTDMSSMFRYNHQMENVNLTGIDTSRVTNMAEMFEQCGNSTDQTVITGFEGLDTSNVTNMANMFHGCNLENLDFSKFNTSNVTDMQGMFSWGTTKTLNLSSFDTSKVTDMSDMFAGCNVENLDLSSFNTSNVVHMDGMFEYMPNITELDLSGFDTSKVENMYQMFCGCEKLWNLNLSNFDTSKVISMEFMFESCSSLKNLDLTGFDTSNVVSMYAMFWGCSALTSLNLSGFDMSSVTNISSMFENCSGLMNLDISIHGIPSLRRASEVFNGCDNLIVIEAPCGLTKSIGLPGMYTGLDDGILYTELPLNQERSITLSFVSASGDAAGNPEQPVIRVITQPESIDVKNGDTASFHVDAEGENLAYQWYSSKDGKRWSPVTGSAFNGTDTNTLSFTMGTGYADTYYNCKITGGPADNRLTLFTDCAQLHLDIAFSIIDDPDDVFARVGEAVSFNVGVEGSEIVTYQWQWSADGENWKNCTSSGYNTDTFTFKMSKVLDGRQYRCLVSDGINMLTSRAAVLSLINPLTITEQPADTSAGIGEQITLHIGTNKDEVTYQWEWSADGENWKNCTSSGCNTDTFSFKMARVLDKRQYRCTVTDSTDLLISRAATITLAKALTILEHPADTSAKVGEQVSLHVRTDGNNVTYQWQWSSNGTNWKNCTSSGCNTDAFGFRMAATLDGRQYRCVVSDGVDTVESSPAVINLAPSLEITEQPENTEAEVGAQIILYIKTNENRVTYQWQWSADGKTWKNCTSSGCKTDTFTFKMSAVLDGRQYRCIVSDNTATIESNPAKISLASPMAITEHPADTAADIGEQIMLHVGASGKNLSYQWQWSSNGTTWKNCTSTGCNTDTFGFKMTAVLDGRQYRCTISDGTNTLMSNPANISLKKIGGITEQPADVSAAAGEKVLLHVAAEGMNISYQWQWSNNGTTWKNCTSTGSNTDTFGFKMSSTLNGRQYRCVLNIDNETVISDAAVLTLK